jgi:glyoxylase-like metal-dependent hydrolase (beta-lactamase superfamily II)
VVTTHPDLDHQGGNFGIKNAVPHSLLACGEADKELVEDPHALFQQRYNFAKREHRVGFESDIPWPEAGKRQPVDITFKGGEKIPISSGWGLEVLHVPGHSNGHLAIYDARNRAAFVSDAIHGRGCPRADSTLGIPVTYYYVDTYLSTLRHFENLKIDVLYSGHWPTMRGEEVSDFIAESRRAVEFIEQVLLRHLAKHREGLSLKELVNSVAEAVGEWPKDTWFLATFPVKGHLDRMVDSGRARLVRGNGLPRWQLVS